MVWAMAAAVALNFASSWGQANMQKAQYDAQNIIDRANADAANTVRKANNEFQAAQSSMQNTQRSIGNREKLEAFSDQWGALETNQTRIIDNMTRGNLSSQLRAAADLGALRAQAASRGVGGSSASILRSISGLAAGHAQTQAADNARFVSYDALMNKAGLLRATVNSLDLGQSLPQLDYGINQAPLNQGDYINPMAAGLRSVVSQLPMYLSMMGGGGGGTKMAEFAGNVAGAAGGDSIGAMLKFLPGSSGGDNFFNMA